MMIPTEQRDRLTALLSPFSRDVFLTSYYERVPLHVDRNDPSYFADVFSLAELENILVAGSGDRTGFNMVRSGVPPVNAELLAMERPGVRARFTGKAPTHVLDPRTVVDRFNMGYSLVISDAARFSGRLQRVSGSLQQELGASVQSNLYFTPASAQGFDVHHDTHDTLVMQIEGTKTWQIFAPVVELPIEGQTLPMAAPNERMVLKSQIVMHPGDTLYIPRGFPHAARSGDERTLHVTLALMPLRVIDLLLTLLDAAARTDPAYRRSLPRDWQTSEFAPQFGAMIRNLVEQTLDGPRLEFGRELLLREFFAVSRPEVDQLFSNTQGIAQLCPTATITWRSEAPHLLRRRGSALELFVAGKSLTFPEECTALIERLRSGPISVAAIDMMLPVAGRQVLGALALEGLLSIERPA